MSRAALHDIVGGPEVVAIRDVEDPSPGAGQAAVRVHAAGLNPFDAKARSGFISLPTPFPRRIGSDLAGTVEAVGPGAVYWDGTAVSVGDEVLGRAPGAVAERVIAAAPELTRRPDALPVDVAGGLWVAGLTAVSCLVTVPVGNDDTVLVGGAAGGVGIIAAQLAVAAGARVIGTASQRNHDLLRSLGVEPVTYGVGLAERLAKLVPITVVVDCHGRDALDAGSALGVSTDRMVAIAAYAALDELGVRSAERDARTAQNLARLADRISSRELVLPVAVTYSLDDVVEAFAVLEAPHAAGKIVVLP